MHLINIQKKIDIPSQTFEMSSMNSIAMLGNTTHEKLSSLNFIIYL